MESDDHPEVKPAYRGNPVRRLGTLELKDMLGRSQHTMAWRASDTRSGDEVLLLLPRQRPGTPDLLAHWDSNVRRAARLQHPNVARPVEIAQHGGWPYITYAMGSSRVLGTGLWSEGGVKAFSRMALGASMALAAAHEAGIVHGDLQPYQMLWDDDGQVRVAGWEVSTLRWASVAQSHPAVEALVQRREAATADVLALGVILHGAVTGQPALGEPDVSKVSDRLPPKGREHLALAPSQVMQVPEPVRAIVNRATHSQELLRYRSARTLARALEGWSAVESGSRQTLLGVLAERLTSHGLLPASENLRDRLARVQAMEEDSAGDMTDLLREDLGLAFELIRSVHAAQERDPRRSGYGPVLSIRRAVALMGIDGVRQVGTGMTPWPGRLGPQERQLLSDVLAHCILAGRLAQALRPPGYDAEVAYMVTQVQNLGRLALCHHFPRESAQIVRLTQTTSTPTGEGAQTAGMNERAACFAVLGVDMEAVGAAAARYCGFDDSAWHRWSRITGRETAPMARTDDDVFRITASCANDAIDALRLPPVPAALALGALVQRYGKSLKITANAMREALMPVGLTPEVAREWQRRQGKKAPADGELDLTPGTGCNG